MNIRSQKLLQLPSGASGLFLQDAWTLQELVARLNGLYKSWGYQPVQVPMADYAKVYEEMLPDHDQRRVYHLVDRDGEILMLRWDNTLFLAKQICNLLAAGHGPLRLSYADSIIRHEDSEDIGGNEFFQTGVELIGRPGPEGDAETALLMYQAFRSMDLSPAIHVGSSLLASLACQGLDSLAQARVRSAITLRDAAEVRRLLGPGKEALAELFGLICPASEAQAACATLQPHLSPALAAETAKVAEFTAWLAALEPQGNFTLDCSELGSQNYHSGLVYRAYLPGLPVPAAAGGRYDYLLQRLGHPAPACGFSIMLSRVCGVLEPLATSPAIVAEGPDFARRYAWAQEARKTGGRVCL